jgi:alpha-1,3-glucan synthase
MSANTAWKRHGCYGLGSEQYFNFAVEKALLGCNDDWNALDHFDPTMDTRRMFSRFLSLRSSYPAIQDGFDLTQLGNWTYMIERPGSDGVVTEMGLWSVSRAALLNQKLNGSYTGAVWMLYTNENATKTYANDCQKDLWMKAPFTSDVVVQNLFAPYEQYTLVASGSSFNNDSKAPFFGCLPTVTIEGFGFKALVPVGDWVAPAPALTKFSPGHDARIQVKASDTNATTMDITFEFNTLMNCDSITQSMTFNLSSSGHGGTVSFLGKPSCGTVASPDPSRISGSDTSKFQWSATLQNFADGVLSITLDNPSSSTGNKTGVRSYFLLLSSGGPDSKGTDSRHSSYSEG